MQNSLNPKMGNQDVLIGGIWALGAASTHSLVAIAVRLLDHLPAIELVFFRNALGLMIFLSIVSWRGFWFIQTKELVSTWYEILQIFMACGCGLPG